MALSENASRTRYTIKIKLKLRKWVLKKKSFQLSFERREWAGRSDNDKDDDKDNDNDDDNDNNKNIDKIIVIIG